MASYKQIAARVDWLLIHPALWKDKKPKFWELAKTMQEAGLYSMKTGINDITNILPKYIYVANEVLDGKPINYKVFRHGNYFETAKII